MKVAVFGGTRFVGWHVIEALLKARADVTLFNRGRSREPGPFSRPVTRVRGDRDDAQSLGALFRDRYDAVVDISGYSPAHVQPVIERWSGKIGHYLFCGTSSSYDPSPGGRYSEESPVSRAAGSYGGDKVLAEDALLNSGINATILRAHGVLGRFGGGQPLYIAQRAAAGSPVLLRPGTADKRLNFVRAEDLAACFAAALGRKEAFGQVFNVAGDEACTPKELAALIGEAKLLELSTEFAEAVPDLGLAWMPRDVILDNARIKAALGVSFHPMQDLVAGIMAWARENPRLLRFSPQRFEKKAASGASAPPAWLCLYRRMFKPRT